MNDDKIEVIYSESELEKFRQDILAGNLCDIFLPVSFIRADGYVGAVYDSGGYERYVDLRQVKASVLIGLVTSIIEKAGQGDRRYFFSGEYSLDPRLVFLKTKIPDTALIYKRTAPRSKAEVLSDLKRLLRPENCEIKGEDYIREAMFILNDGTKSFEIIRHDLMAVGTEAYRGEC